MSILKIILCLLLGYLLGSMSPSALIAKVKQTNLREKGSKNLGATNTLLVFGKKYGALVMLFDIAKAFFAVWCAKWIVPGLKWLSLATGGCAILGHCFPFYLKFKGGKGFAAFGGVVLAYNPLLFLFLLISGTVCMLLVNYSFIFPFYTATFFAVYTVIQERTLITGVLATLVAALIIGMHFGNMLKAIKGTDAKIREYIKTKLFKSSNAD